MSAPFTQNRHHLLLAEAHQLNEFLDARLIGAEVPEDQRLAVARDVLELALAARLQPMTKERAAQIVRQVWGDPSTKGAHERALANAKALLTGDLTGYNPDISRRDTFIAWFDECACGDDDWTRLLVMNGLLTPFFKNAEASEVSR